MDGLPGGSCEVKNQMRQECLKIYSSINKKKCDWKKMTDVGEN